MSQNLVPIQGSSCKTAKKNDCPADLYILSDGKPHATLPSSASSGWDNVLLHARLVDTDAWRQMLGLLRLLLRFPTRQVSYLLEPSLGIPVLLLEEGSQLSLAWKISPS